MKFLRRMVHRHSKLGAGRKKKQVWRKPTGRHNKMRLQRKGVPANVKIGYKNDKPEKPIVVYTLNDLNKLNSPKEIIVGKVGLKKKLEIMKKAKEMKIKVTNLNEKKILKKTSKFRLGDKK